MGTFQTVISYPKGRLSTTLKFTFLDLGGCKTAQSLFISVGCDGSLGSGLDEWMFMGQLVHLQHLNPPSSDISAHAHMRSFHGIGSRTSRGAWTPSLSLYLWLHPLPRSTRFLAHPPPPGNALPPAQKCPCASQTQLAQKCCAASFGQHCWADAAASLGLWIVLSMTLVVLLSPSEPPATFWASCFCSPKDTPSQWVQDLWFSSPHPPASGMLLHVKLMAVHS